MRLILSFATIIVMLTSCVTKQKCVAKFPPAMKDSVVIKDSVAVHDSIVVKFEKKDSVVIIPGSSGSDSMPCSENQKSTIRRGGDTFIISVRNGVVRFSYDLAGTMSRFTSEKESMQREIDTYKTFEHNRSTSEVNTIEVVKPMGWFKKAIMTLGYIMFSFILLGVIYFCVKLYWKIRG